MVRKVADLPGGIRLYINENDHEPPHLHLYCGEGAFKIHLDSLEVEVIAGSRTKARTQLWTAKVWMRDHSDFLIEQWQRKRRGEKVRPFNPRV